MILNAKNVVWFKAQPVANPSQPVAICKAATLEPMPIDRLLHWAYAIQLVDRARGGFEPGGASIDSCQRLVQRSELGVSVDGSAGANKVHPDADMIHEAVMTLKDKAEIGLLVHYARCGTTPDWLPNAKIAYRPVKNARGKPKKLYDHNRHPIACLVDVTASMERIAYARKVYSIWWNAMARLVQTVDTASLQRYQPLAPSCPPRPWRG